jgi:hypothetical protein
MYVQKEHAKAREMVDSLKSKREKMLEALVLRAKQARECM